MKRLLLLTLSLFLSGCSTFNGVSPNSLEKPTSLSYFILTEDVVFTATYSNILGMKATLSPKLLKGKYNSVYRDVEGTYYEGPKGCLPNANAMYKSLDGGLWLPHVKGHKARLWFYLKGMPDGSDIPANPTNSQSASNGVIVNSTANSTANSIASGIILGLDRMSAGNVKKDLGIIESTKFINDIEILKY